MTPPPSQPFRSFPLHRIFHVLPIVALLLLRHATLTDAAAAEPKLIFVAELCRHGDRAPLFSFPSDRLPLSQWSEGPGQLTAIGQRAHYDLGARLRAELIDSPTTDAPFLSPSYVHTEVHVRSTDIDRTLMSAHSQLAGLYPPGTNPLADVRVRFGGDPLQVDEAGLPHRFQPIPIHTTPKDKDNMLLPGANCPRHDAVQRAKYASSPLLKAKAAEQQPFLRQLAAIAKVPHPDRFSIHNAHDLADTWTCAQAHGVPLPDGATPDVVRRVNELSDWLLDFDNTNDEVRRLRAGLTLYTVAQYAARAAIHRHGALKDGALAPKFLFLSAHDTTVAATLAALKVFDGRFPPYNSTMFWHVHETAAPDGSSSSSSSSSDSKRADPREIVKRLAITVRYNGKPLHIPGCDSARMCPLEQYLAATADATVQGEDERWELCQTGWRRAAARLAAAARRRRHSPTDLAGLVDNPAIGIRNSGAPGSSASSGATVRPGGATDTLAFGVLLGTTVGAVVLGALITSLTRFKRYRGYARAFPSDNAYGTAGGGPAPAAAQARKSLFKGEATL